MGAKCQATCLDGRPCPKAPMVGTDLCWNHTKNPKTGGFPEPKPIDRAAEIRYIEKQLRGVYRLVPSLERSREIRALIELMERLRASEAPATPDVKDLTVEERLALRG